MKPDHHPAIAAGFAAQALRSIVERTQRDIRFGVDGRGAEEVSVGFPCGEAGQVLEEFPDQIRPAARIAPVQRGVRIGRAVQVVVVQAVHDTVSAHREPLYGCAGASRGVVQPALLEQPIVRGVVREDEERMLARADEDDARDDHERRPPVQGDRDQSCEH